MTKQKLTKAQQKVLDALANGATLRTIPMSSIVRLCVNGIDHPVRFQTLAKLADLQLIKPLRSPAGRDNFYGLATPTVADSQA